MGERFRRLISLHPMFRHRVRSAAVAAAVAMTLNGGPGVVPASAGHPLPVVLVVTTTSDDEYPADLGCSLRAAIEASNNFTAGYCGAGTGGHDLIVFDIGSGVPTINVVSDLPQITNGVTIDGHTGGAKRVELHGQGATNGLQLVSSGSVIRSLVIDGFGTGVYNSGSDDTVADSRIVSNGTGIYSPGGITVGGTNTHKNGAACSGDCNVVSGNSNSGLYVASGGVIKGNLIGTTADGKSSQPNGVGILVSSGGWTIGGSSAGERNVISGNASHGLNLNSCGPCLVQGNYIGTTASGKAALANGGDGIRSQSGNGTIGGTSASARNIISGNAGAGINLWKSTNYVGDDVLAIYGNRIGVGADGSALGNGSDGIHLGSQNVHGTIIGAVGVAGAANTIAYNGGFGVAIDGSTSFHNSVRGNSIHHNTLGGIMLSGGANGGIAAPVITGVGPMTGTACAGCTVDIYSDGGSQGKTHAGTAIADGGGTWNFSGAVAGPKATATATDSSSDTSAFSAPVTATPRRPDGRIRKGSGSYVGDNIYNNTGANQTRSGKGAKGATLTFGVSVQNDGPSDSFLIHAFGSATSQYTITYLHGSTDITAAVVAGSFTTPALSSGSTYLITVKVKVGSTASASSSVTRFVSIISTNDGSKVDTVKFITKRK
jgi:CSLREA domain-containing protein